MLNDPISDMITRIRNGLKAGKGAVSCPASKTLENVLKVLKDEGYIRGYNREPVRKGIENLNVELKYYDEAPVIKKIKRVSTPGRRVYSNIKELPLVRNGLGCLIVSTPKGIMSDREARESNVGGEVLCEVF